MNFFSVARTALLVGALGPVGAVMAVGALAAETVAQRNIDSLPADRSSFREVAAVLRRAQAPPSPPREAAVIPTRAAVASAYQPYEASGNYLGALRRVHVAIRRARGVQGFNPIVAVAGVANVGKSSLLNAFVSVLAGKQCTVVRAGGMPDGGKVTVRATRQPLLALSESNRDPDDPVLRARVGDAAAPVPAADRYELTAIDVVGLTESTDMNQLRLSLLGKLRNELYDPDMLDTYQRRQVPPEDAARAICIAIPANTIMNTRPADANDPIGWIRLLKLIVRMASDYSVNTASSYQLPVHIIITKVDEYANVHGVTDPRWLLHKESGPFARVYERLRDLVGVSAVDATAIGWLDRDLAFNDGRDPRVIVLLSLMERMAISAAALTTSMRHQ